ncbi:MAG TPA: type IV pilus biogenesis/stability protein PilW [Gammaproteobacteria bacterium]|jgi:type IV pilus assembly protein PilF|nr:type IV pilus biogenesis/stability protein PilW [Gammaproteobacteria bacterium]
MMKQNSWWVVACLVLALSGCNQSNVKPGNDKTSPAAANVELGVLYMREGKKNVAMDVLQKALKQDPNSADAHNAIAVLYESLGETDKADTHFKRALSLNSQDSQAHNNYGSFLCRNQRADEAEKHYLAAAANPLYETPELSYTNAGSCAYNAKDTAKAEQYWRKALELNAQFSPALLQMARLNVNQKNYMSARAYLQRFHAVARPSPESLWLGIQTERVLGDKNAEASYSMLLKNGYPDSPQAKQLSGQ